MSEQYSLTFLSVINRTTAITCGGFDVILSNDDNSLYFSLKCLHRVAAELVPVPHVLLPIIFSGEISQIAVNVVRSFVEPSGIFILFARGNVAVIKFSLIHLVMKEKMSVAIFSGCESARALIA